MNNYHIITFDGNAYFHFFTEAENSKIALKNLQNNSSDYKNICNEENNIEIKTIKL